MITISCVCAKSLQSYPTLCVPIDCSPPGSSVHDKNIGACCHALLLMIFPTQGSNLCQAGKALQVRKEDFSFLFFQNWFFKTLKTKVYILWLLQWLSSKESTCNAGDPGDAGSSPWREGNDNPLQYSSLGNPMDRGACRVSVWVGLQRVGHD